jgi:hypothetical protein
MSIRRRRFGAALGLFFGLVALPAQAEAAGDARGHWYGWQTLVSDAVGLGLVVGSFTYNGDANGFTLAGAGVWALGAPLVHVAHARYLPALGSLTLRVGLPALAYAVASAECRAECGAKFLGALLLVPVAVIFPTVFDAGHLAWERSEKPGPVAYPSGLRSLRPVLTVVRDAPVLGLAGSL